MVGTEIFSDSTKVKREGLKYLTDSVGTKAGASTVFIGIKRELSRNDVDSGIATIVGVDSRLKVDTEETNSSVREGIKIVDSTTENKCVSRSMVSDGNIVTTGTSLKTESARLEKSTDDSKKFV